MRFSTITGMSTHAKASIIKNQEHQHMEQIVLTWKGPFGIRSSIPEEMKGCPGLYLIEYDSEILYVGKAETEGAFRRAKDHFRGQGDSTGRWILQGRDESQIHIWVAMRSWDELISNAEQLLICRCNPRANVNHVDKYDGKTLRIINEGNYPGELDRQIESS